MIGAPLAQALARLDHNPADAKLMALVTEFFGTQAARMEVGPFCLDSEESGVAYGVVLDRGRDLIAEIAAIRAASLGAVWAKVLVLMSDIEDRPSESPGVNSGLGDWFQGMDAEGRSTHNTDTRPCALFVSIEADLERITGN